MTAEPEPIAISGAQAMIYRNAPAWNGLKCAAIGGVEFTSIMAGCELLLTAMRQLKIEGYGGLLGPMDGDTWHNYRVVVESDGSEPFPLEPVSGPHDLSAFLEAGFLPVSDYVSTRGKLIDVPMLEGACVEGVTITNWDGKNAEKPMSQVFEISCQSFSGNQFYKPIDVTAFLDLYEPVLEFADPRHILFAKTSDGSLVGFLFGMPFYRPGDARPVAIVKSYASRVRGVGRLLIDAYHRRVIDMGFEEMIHALMHEDSVSRNRSGRYNTEAFRHYALMGMKL